jgi:hypothetical protein
VLDVGTAIAGTSRLLTLAALAGDPLLPRLWLLDTLMASGESNEDVIPSVPDNPRKPDPWLPRLLWADPGRSGCCAEVEAVVSVATPPVELPTEPMPNPPALFSRDMTMPKPIAEPVADFIGDTPGRTWPGLTWDCSDRSEPLLFRPLPEPFRLRRCTARRSAFTSSSVTPVPTEGFRFMPAAMASRASQSASAMVDRACAASSSDASMAGSFSARSTRRKALHVYDMNNGPHDGESITQRTCSIDSCT